MTDVAEEEQLPDINISATAKRNGLTITVFSALTALIGLALVLSQQQVWGPLLLMAAIVGLSLGIAKLQHPPVSIRLTPEGLCYYQIRGVWHIRWQDLQRIDIPTTGELVQSRELPFVGISLRHQAPLLSEISLRLCIGILTEQRALLHQALRAHCPQGRCPSDLLFEKNRFTDPSGRHYQGIRAMFGHRMKVMRELLGYELYIPTSALDRPPEDFIALIRKYKAAALVYTHATQPPAPLPPRPDITTPDSGRLDNGA